MRKLILAGLLALTAVCPGFTHAQDTPLVSQQFRDFSGGLNDNMPAINLPANESPRLQNVVLDDPIGALRTRNGFTQCGVLPSGNTGRAAYEFFKSDGSRRLIVTDGANYYQTADCVSFTTMKTGLSTNSQPTFATIRDKVWIVTRTTHTMVWDGITLTMLDAHTSTPNPAPPLCSYIQFWKERVWCGRTSNDSSGVAFSALTDTSGNSIDPSTGSAAWPVLNLIQIDQNGGSPIYGLKVYRDSLFVFKNNGIWRIDFENEFRLEVIKTLSSVGSRFHESIIELDNLLYFVGPDGIYGFDGENSARISDKAENLFRSLNQPLISTLFKTWTSQADFEAGTFSSSTASGVIGAVTISTQPTGLTNGNFESASTSPWVCTYISTAGTGSNCGLTTSSPLEGAQSLQFAFTGTAGGGGALTAYFFTNAGTTIATVSSWSASVTTETVDLSAYAGSVVRAHFAAVLASGAEMHLYSGTFTAVGILTFQYEVYDGANFQRGFMRLDNFRTDVHYASATWTSEIYNFVSVSTWTTLEANYVSNGGAVSFEIRYGTNAGAAQAMSFQTITPGSVIAASTSQVHAQLRVTLSSGALGSPQFTDATINYSQGGATVQTIFGAQWKNRAWWSASSGTATTNNIVIVKSKAPSTAIVPYDLKIGAMVRYSDNFYAMASTHSAIYRLDYGTNDNGVAIDAYWESRDEVWGRPQYAKRLQEILLDYEKGSASSMSISWSKDGGNSWSTKTADFSGSGRGVKRLFPEGQAPAFRFRIRNANKDQAFRLFGLEVLGIPYRIREY